MKLAFVIPSLQPGGMERVMCMLLQNFAEHKESFELHLIIYGIKRDIFYDIPNSIVIHRPDFTFNNRWRLWHTLKTLYFLRRKIQALKPDSILSFGERWNNLVLLSGLGLDWPIYVSDRCQPNKSLGKMQDLLRIWLYPKAKGIIAQTEKAKDIFQNLYHHPNIQVIGNPIKKVNFNHLETRENIVLSVGRLIDSKHHAELIQLFAKLNSQSWKLVIVGGDALKQTNFKKLTELINTLGVRDRVQLTGAIKNVEYWYRKARVFAFPSSSEGFPNVIGEALSAGLPVVAFDCVAGPSDMVRSGHNGYLIELFNYEDFSEKLALLMNDYAHREQLAIHAPLSIKRFERDEVTEQFYQFITKEA